MRDGLETEAFKRLTGVSGDQLEILVEVKHDQMAELSGSGDGDQVG